MIKEVTRKIKKEVERELWGRSAARCEFNGCNKLLYKHGVTHEPVNLAEMAHIYSFSKDGPRGWGIFQSNRTGINDLGNLLLVCHDCHKLVDADKDGVIYSAELLKRWKLDHENRIRVSTGLVPSKSSQVVLYGSRIGEDLCPLNMGIAYDAMFPNWYAHEGRSVDLTLGSQFDDSSPEYWTTEERNLEELFNRRIRPLVESGEPGHFSLFALAPQPLLIKLGALFTDKVHVEVYQPNREPKTWQRQPHPEGTDFVVKRPEHTSGIPVMLFSLSDHVDRKRIHRVAGDEASVWEVTTSDPNNDFLRSETQLADFRRNVRSLLVDIRQAHAGAAEILIFPVMPVACAIELGRVRMPKVDLPWAVFDHDKKQNEFVRRLTISGAQ